MRRLDAEEAAIWARIAGTVRPITGKSIPTSDAEPAPGKRIKPVRPNTAPLTSYSPPRTSSHNTLDASWDRRLDQGRAVPDRTIDLHGLTQAEAHARLAQSLRDAVTDGARVLLVVTGRAPRSGTRLDLPHRGIIRASIGDWLAASSLRSRIAAVRNAHPRHGGAGALYVILRRSTAERAS